MPYFRNSGLAEKIFNSIEPKTAEAYCALICGMAKYGQVSGAWEYYSQMQGKGYHNSTAAPIYIVLNRNSSGNAPEP